VKNGISSPINHTQGRAKQVKTIQVIPPHPVSHGEKKKNRHMDGSIPISPRGEPATHRSMPRNRYAIRMIKKAVKVRLVRLLWISS
jgi:hypothetical protein